MTLILVGMSHHTAPVGVRERYAVAPAQGSQLAARLCESPHLVEAMVISTCNRTELLGVAEAPDKGSEVLEGAVLRDLGDGTAEPEHLYRLQGRDVVRHLFRVASGLDSMVLGEPQILGQVKLGYQGAAEVGSLGPLLSRLCHRSFRAAKRVRSETGLGAASVSLARVGVQLAREIFEALAEKRIVLVGAGEMAESALHGFFEAGVRELCVLNRTLESAERLAARYGGRPAMLSELDAQLVSADVLLSSVAVERPLLTLARVEQAMAQRQGRPLLLIDLGMPRNIAPAVNGLDDAYLYDVDDLSEVARRGSERRRAAVQPAEAILTLEIESFERWYAAREAVPTIRELVHALQKTGREEASRTAARLATGSGDVQPMLEQMADAIVAKILHRPIAQLRAEASEGQPPFLAEAVREVFGLKEDEE